MTEIVINSWSQSMKNLTEKVLKADLASRKRKMISFKAGKLTQILMVPFVYYALKVKLLVFE